MKHDYPIYVTVAGQHRTTLSNCQTDASAVTMKEAMERSRSRQPPGQPDYAGASGHSLALHYLFECGIKLNARPATVATAAILFHKFFREVERSDYDCYAIGAACLILAGKFRDDPLRQRDVLNVSHGALHRGQGPLELGEEYWSLRSSLAAAELLVLRTLQFRPDLPSHHRYLLQYLESLRGAFPPSERRFIAFARTAVAFLHDFHHSSAVLDYKPTHVAVACICLALNCLGIAVPLLDGQEDDAWFSAFIKDLTKDKNWEIMEKIMNVYNKEQDA